MDDLLKSDATATPLLKALLESLPFRFWACNTEGRCILQNAVSLRDFGPFVGRLMSELPIPQEVLSRWDENARRTLAGEVVSQDSTFELKGELRSYRYTMGPIRNAEGRILGLVMVSIDISELRRIEAALTESEERLRSITDNAPDIIIQANIDGEITYINRVYPSVTMDQAVGTNLCQWVPPAYQPVVQNALAHVFTKAEPYRYETQGIGINGELAWYSTRLSPVVINGQVTSVILICSDMTESQRAEAALRESEEKFRQLANSIDEGFWLISLAPERLLYINAAFERIWGLPAASLYAETRAAMNSIHPQQRETIQRQFDDWLAGRVDEYEVEYRIVRPDGSIRWIHDHAARIYDEKGQLYRASGIVRDITGRKLAEEAIRESESRYRLLAENSSDLISRHAPDGSYLYVSPACQTLLGYTPESLLGKNAIELIHADDVDACKAKLEEMVTTGRSETATFRIRRADGHYVWFETQGRAVLDPENHEVREIVATSRDVTERMEANRKLRQREADLAHAERLSTMGQMASEMAHELNQPLYAIANFAEACRGTLKDLPAGVNPDLRRWIDQIAQQARRAGDVVRRVTHFVRKGELDQSIFDLNQCIRDVAGLLEFGLRSKGVEVRFELDRGPLTVLADRLLIEQVLVNLMRNGIDAMAETELERRKLTIRSFSVSDVEVGVAVKDQGRGLPPGQADRLFEPYFTTKSDGTGMGLPICRSTIEAHRGKICAKDDPAGGAIFQFVLPRFTE